MACYMCLICEHIVDGDYDVPTEYKHGLICEDCAAEIEDRKERNDERD